MKERNTYRYKCILRSVILSLGLFLTIPMIAGDVVVGGTLSEDQVWTPDNTYYVVQDLRIGQGILLTIQPGVTIKIDQGRGIQLNGGDIIVGDLLGLDTDTVKFFGNYREGREGWKWKGIFVENVGDENKVFFSYVSIQDAEIGLDIKDGYYITIQHSSISNNQNIGVRLTNSSRCIVNNCGIENNYDGIEFVSTNQRVCENNTLWYNKLNNINHNIYMRNETGGTLVENTLKYNIIEGGNNGIWMDNDAGGVTSNNQIANNVFVENGSGFGYGILLAFDSTQVINNIFWANNIALNCDPVGRGNHIIENSFYANVRGVQVGSGSSGNTIVKNTLSHQYFSDVEVKETIDTQVDSNNYFPMDLEHPIFFNRSHSDLVVRNIFWGVEDTLSINQLIWDNDDDSLLGKVSYQPFLIDPDTLWPMSPPDLVKKQLVNGDVRLSWSQNREQDLLGYKVYYDGFSYYQFLNDLDLGLVNTVLLADASIEDSLAVTAYDRDIILPEAQFLGHESPYAFAQYYPYAGENDQFCVNQSKYLVQKSSVPYNYDLLSWKTTGDGTFDDPSLLYPNYFPGVEDKVHGSVVLSLNVLNAGEWLSDSFKLTFFNAAQVYAGADTTLFDDEVFALNQSVVSDISQLVWTSDGDGQFDNDSLLHPVYQPGNMDKELGKVTLILTGENVCGIDVDTIHVSIVQRFLLHGSVWQKGVKLGGQAVIAFANQDEGQRAIAQVNTSSQGDFLFNTLRPGDYLLYAVPDTLEESTCYPGYYVEASRWNEGYSLALDADVYDVDIHLPALEPPLPIGGGSISGHYASSFVTTTSSSVYCNSWFDSDSTNEFCVGGNSNITVLLYNSTHEKVLDYAITDYQGNFYFHHLPMGRYVLDAEKAGLVPVPSSVLELTPSAPSITDIILNESQFKILISREGVLPPASADNFCVYPNPTSNSLRIKTSSYELAYFTIHIFDTYGRLVMAWDNTDDIYSEKNILLLNVGSFRQGLYFGLFKGETMSKPFSFVVR